AALALYDPGTEVLVPNPGFVLYAPHAKLAGAVPVPYSLYPAQKYIPDFDEVYEDIVYGTTATSFWGRSDRVVIANSFSKTLAMTGWRLGFLVAPKSYAAALNKIHYHILACPSTPVQVAVLAGIGNGSSSFQAMLKEFKARRELVTRLLGKMP